MIHRGAASAVPCFFYGAVQLDISIVSLGQCGVVSLFIWVGIERVLLY